MVTADPKEKLKIKEGDTPFTFLFSQRETAAIIAVILLPND